MVEHQGTPRGQQGLNDPKKSDSLSFQTPLLSERTQKVYVVFCVYVRNSQLPVRAPLFTLPCPPSLSYVPGTSNPAGRWGILEEEARAPVVRSICTIWAAANLANTWQGTHIQDTHTTLCLTPSTRVRKCPHVEAPLAGDRGMEGGKEFLVRVLALRETKSLGSCICASVRQNAKPQRERHFVALLVL